MSAPASTQARARSIAASRPSTASASVRAMMTKSGSVRASTAALMRSTISCLRDELLAGPVAAALGADLVLDVHRGGAELDQRACTVRAMLNADAPKPVSASTSSGSGARVGDAAHVGQHVVEVADAEVGQAERAGRDAAAGQVDRLEPAALARASRDTRRSRRAPAAAARRRPRRESGAPALAAIRAATLRSWHHRRSDATPARSSSSSFSVASIFSRENASIGKALDARVLAVLRDDRNAVETSFGMP